MGNPVLLVALGAIFVAVASVVYVLVTASVGTRGTARSLELIERTVAPREVGRAELPASERLLVPLLDNLRGLATRLSPQGTAARISRQLDIAGNPRAWTVDRVMGAKGLALILGAVLGFVLGGFGFRGLLFAVPMAAIGFFLPDLLVYNAGLKRQDELRKGLADSVDMLTVCVEAGQGFDAALLQVARSVEGPIAGEFARVLSEIQMGRSRSDSFALMASRSTVPEVKNFISSLVQADKLGIPIAEVLREQTRNMRLVRRQRAEEKAQKVPIKILFPLLLCIFPALMVVIMGPGIIKLIDAFSQTF